MPPRPRLRRRSRTRSRKLHRPRHLRSPPRLPWPSPKSVRYPTRVAARDLPALAPGRFRDALDPLTILHPTQRLTRPRALSRPRQMPRLRLPVRPPKSSLTTPTIPCGNRPAVSEQSCAELLHMDRRAPESASVAQLPALEFPRRVVHRCPDPHHSGDHTQEWWPFPDLFCLSPGEQLEQQEPADPLSHLRLRGFCTHSCSRLLRREQGNRCLGLCLRPIMAGERAGHTQHVCIHCLMGAVKPRPPLFCCTVSSVVAVTLFFRYRGILDPQTCHVEILRIGYLLLCVWGSLRWGDALWCPPSRLHYQPQSHALVGILSPDQDHQARHAFRHLSGGALRHFITVLVSSLPECPSPICGRHVSSQPTTTPRLSAFFSFRFRCSADHFRSLEA